MKTHNAELLRIKDLLRNNPKGMKITRIARELAMNRNAAAKYLEILLMTGQVEVFEHGMSKIFILSRRTGIPTMLDGSSDLILVLDSDRKIARVNDNYLRFAERKQEELLGKRIDITGLPVIRCPQVLEKIRQAYFGEDIRTETREICDNGKVLFFDIRVTPAIFNDGSRGITIIISDVTHEKKLQESVTGESRTLVEGVLSCIDDAVVLLDPGTGEILFLNPAARAMFGSVPDEFIRRDAGPLAGVTGTIPGSAAKMADAFRLQGYYETVCRLKRSDGGEFPGSLQFRPVYDRNGGVRNIVMVIRDITIPNKSVQGASDDAGNPVVPYPARSTPVVRRTSSAIRNSA